MSREKGNTPGIVILVAVILIAFLFITPFFRFSCSRVFLHDFLGLENGLVTPGLALAPGNIMHLVPLVLMLLVWGAVTLWVYHDAERRGHSGLLWGLFVFIGNVIGLIIYLILRVPSPDAADTGPGVPAKCPSCSNTIQSSYVACPFCGIKLENSCNSCGKPVEAGWKACPYCGAKLNDL
jgi:DNA-directed RNA polymerase subunit RPC12/RpoP